MEAQSINEEIQKSFAKNITSQEANQMNPLNLAYIGDAIYEVYIRKYLLLNYNGKVNDVNKKCVKFVKATAQSRVINAIMEKLTLDEVKVVKRGRNASSKTVPKNTELIDYKMATGFEALLGYLYLTGNRERLEEIIKKGINITLAAIS